MTIDLNQVINKCYRDWTIKNPDLRFLEHLETIDPIEKIVMVFSNLFCQIKEGGIEQWLFYGYDKNYSLIMSTLEKINTDESIKVLRLFQDLDVDIQISNGWMERDYDDFYTVIRVREILKYKDDILKQVCEHLDV